MQSKARRRGPRESGAAPVSGMAAAAAVLLLSLVMLDRHAPVLDVLKFTAFAVLGVGLPGLVLWRLIGAYRRNLVEDCAAAFAIGTSVQLVVYLAGASVGLQRWTWVWAPVVLLVAVLDRDVRERVWRRVEAPLRPVTAWLLAAASGVVLFAVLRTGPDRYAPPYTTPDPSYPDMAFHQALAASAKTDVPIVPLWVAGEPMKYHTFFHQLAAATSWGTGIDLTHLVYGLAWLPLMLACCALVFVLTQRFLVRPGREPHPAATWAGPLAVLVAGLGGALQPLHDQALGGVSMATAAYLSPSQNLGLMLGLLLVVVCVDLLRDQPPRTRWILAILLALAASGAKATVLPLVVCGFGLVFFVRLVAGRPARIAVVGGVVMMLVFVGSVIAIFGGESSGLQIKPGAVFIQLPPYADLRDGAGVDRAAQLLSAAATLTAWGLAVVGVLFLRRFWRDPATAFLAGLSIGAFVATVLTTQPGISQMYFYRTAVPFLVVLSCLGLAQLIERLEDRRAAVLVAVASAAGLIACLLAREAASGQAGVKLPFLWTIGALLAVALVVAVGWRSIRRTGRAPTAFFAAAVAACMVGATALPLAGLVSDQASLVVYGRTGMYGPTKAQADAARWLRVNSGRDDLVATNAHCIVQRGTVCDSRHFWIAALSERQVLVEGWAYTNRANRIAVTTGVNPSVLPFWDQRLLAANDAAFTAPSDRVIERLRQYGVRWLYADRRAGEISPALKQYVRLRHATADATVYEIR
ncbi:hypothetical protein Kfla_0501 [Kribbella flavida DSM 17836]|uniref:Uncharacterized protein n=1 Tax=Kribbella flavida (strain DSM 17836 / JCM 10339 / NBRC 14399) TaxID=479435 RepID=D2PVW6_KRIFD|nr:hypothetical protein [Kribbella flavida]ADB29623.1 hypothetical protein Kfla_0501 [Kribbella flavida DSM 17836]